MGTRRSNLLALGLAVALTTSASAQTAAPDFSRVRVWRAGEEVLALAQTPDGLLWAGTSAGLLRYDGREFQWEETTPGARRAVNALVASPDGGLWVGQDGTPAIARLSGAQRQTWGEREGVAPGRVRTLVGDGGDGVWVGGEAGLWSIAASGAVKRAAWMPAGQAVRALGRSDDGALWIGSDDGLGCARGDHYARLWAQGPVNAVLPLGRTKLLVSVVSRASSAG